MISLVSDLGKENLILRHKILPFPTELFASICACGYSRLFLKSMIWGPGAPPILSAAVAMMPQAAGGGAQV